MGNTNTKRLRRGGGGVEMPTFEFLVTYSGKAFVTVEADNIDEAREKLVNDSCAIDDNAEVENGLEFEIEIEDELGEVS
jgi:hypothetical protein